MVRALLRAARRAPHATRAHPRAAAHSRSALAEADAGIALSAALWHDIGRVNHDWDPQHGALSAAGQDDPERSLRILWLLKDADALDRVRLGGGAYDVDSTALRHECTLAMVGFAEELLSVMP